MLLVALTILVAPLFVACNTQASATEVRVNGSSVTATPATKPRPSNLVPPPAGVAPKQLTPTAAPVISARASIVIDDATGAVLYEYNSHTRLAPASLTKIATAALAIDRGNLDQSITVDFDLGAQPGLDDATEMGLRKGDRFTLRDLIYGMLLPSGADASLAIAHAVSGSEGAFVQQLNAFMESLKLYDTHFVDPHGIGGPAHLSTAYDIAMLSRYALRQPLFEKVVHTDEYKAVGSRTIMLGNTNPWMFTYHGANGVKNGFTEEAGPTLSASATKSGHRVIVVVLNASQRNKDTTALMDWAFQTFCWGDGALGCATGAPSATSTPAR